MTTNDIIDGISIKINELFGEKYEIYIDDVKQGLELPCFFIRILPSNKKRLIGNRFENTVNLVIYVMLNDIENKTEKLNDIADKLYELEYITLINKDIIKGYDMKNEKSDNTLLFFITYKYFTIISKSEDKMENLTEKGEIKIE